MGSSSSCCGASTQPTQDASDKLEASADVADVVEDTTLTSSDWYQPKGAHVEGLFATLGAVFKENANGQADPTFKPDFALFHKYNEHPQHLEEYRASTKRFHTSWALPEVNKTLDQWYDQVTIEKLEGMGGSDFCTDAEKTRGFVIKVKGKPSVSRPCMLYFHGGACIAGEPEVMEHVMVRYAVQCDVTVVASSYRLAPENPVPIAGVDGYAVAKWVLANADALGIDPARFTVWGESGGSKTATECAMHFAEKGEAHRIKFVAPLACVTGNQYLRAELKGDQSCLCPHEVRGAEMQANVARCFTPDAEAGLTDPWVYPNEMSDELCRKMPPMAIYTCEFDSQRSGSEEARDLYRRNGRLLAFANLGGHNHCTWCAFDLPGSEEHFTWCEKLMKKYI